MCKRCPLCGLEKPSNAFSKDRSKSSGLASRCRECNKQVMRDWAAANPDRRNAWAAANPEKSKEARLRDYAKHRERRVRDACAWQARNPEKVAERQREFYGRQRAALAEGYIRRVLAQTTNVPREEIPQSLIDLKREHLRLVRELKEKQA